MRAARSSGLALGACLVVVAAGSRVARAADAAPRFGLLYEAEPELGCPDGEQVRAALRERLEYEAFVREGESASDSVRITVSRAGSGLQARIDWVDARGQSEGGRQLVSANADCAELARGLVFAVAVQVQLRASHAAEPVPAPAPAPAPAPTPTPTVTSTERPVTRPKPSAPSPWLVVLGAGGGLERGWSPETSPRLGGLAAVSRGRAWLEAGFGGSTLVRQTASDGSGFESRTTRAWLAPCVRTPPWGWCAVGVVGGLHVRGFGVDYPESPGTMMGAVGGRMEVLLPVLRNFAVLGHLEVLGTLTPRDVTLNGETRWSTSPLYLGVGIDLALIFR